MTTTLRDASATIYQQLLDDCIDDPFNLPEARLFIVADTGKVEIIRRGGDVYRLLEYLPLMTNIVGDAPIIGIETCGWARPINEDGDVNMSGAKVRARLVVLVDRALQLGTTCGIQGDDDVLSEVGEPTGMLATAMVGAMAAVNTIQARIR